MTYMIVAGAILVGSVTLAEAIDQGKNGGGVFRLIIMILGCIFLIKGVMAL